jgi:hypothetical protein
MAPSSPASILRQGGSLGRIALIRTAAAIAPIFRNSFDERIPAALRSRAVSRPIFGKLARSVLPSDVFIIIFFRVSYKKGDNGGVLYLTDIGHISNSVVV